MPSWVYNGMVFEEQPKGFFGFVYLITNTLSGRMYVGRKYFTLKQGKKRIESDWKAYWGSCKPLLDDIQAIGQENFKREILSLYEKRGEVNYGEVREQILRDVLKAKFPDGSRMYYNGNIMNRWYAAKEEHTAETKKKISSSPKGHKNSLGMQHIEEWKQQQKERMTGNTCATGSIRTPEMKVKYSKAKKGITKTEEHRQKLSQSLKGSLQSDETKQKRKETLSKLRWWTNGVQSQRAPLCPDGWQPGRASFKKLKD